MKTRKRSNVQTLKRANAETKFQVCATSASSVGDPFKFQVRRFRKSLVLVAVVCFLPTVLSGQKLALTFERLPAMKPYGFNVPRELSNLILRALEKHSIQAMGFVIDEKIDEVPTSYIVLQDWLQKGHALGNNTYGYVDFNLLSVDDFLAHVSDGHKHLRQASRSDPSRPNVRYFRFPQLHVGLRYSKRKELAKILDDAGFVIVPATVVPSDYAFNWVYRDYQTDMDALDVLKGIYIEHFEAALQYAETQGEAVFQRPIPHIVRLHAGLATANFLAHLLEHLKSRGYSFVTVQQALEDEAFQAEDEYAGPLGLSFTDRVAATRGLSPEPSASAISEETIRALLEKQLKQP